MDTLATPMQQQTYKVGDRVAAREHTWTVKHIVSAVCNGKPETRLVVRRTGCRYTEVLHPDNEDDVRRL